jgi:hypothetical protein
MGEPGPWRRFHCPSMRCTRNISATALPTTSSRSPPLTSARSWSRSIPRLAHAIFLQVYRCCGSGSGIRCLFDPLDPGSGMGKKSGSGSGISSPDHISESFETIFWVKIIKFLDAVPGSGMKKKFGSGINNAAKYTCIVKRCLVEF